MSESFVDLSYRGLALGKKIKLTQVRPATGYLEMPTPMPVGSLIAIATDDGMQIEAIVAEVHEQVAGTDKVPGMLVKPRFDAAAAESWWKTRTDLPDTKLDKAAPPADAGGKVTVKSGRMTGEIAVPEVVDDGRNTAVMEAIGPDMSGSMDTQIAEVPHDTPPSPRDTNPHLAVASDSEPGLPGQQDDGKRTMMMDAVDLAALGLSSPSGQMAAVKPEDYVDDTSGPVETSGPTDTTGKPKKKTRKRRS